MPITATNVAFLNTRYIAALDKATRINKHLDSQIKKLLKKNSKVFEPLYKTFLKCKSPAELNKINPADLPQNKELQYLLTRILQYSELYGRYSNLGTESFSSSNLGTKSSSSSNYIQNSKLDLSIDYDMTYNEAAEWFKSLKVIYAPDFYDELRRNAGYSWTISYITQADTLNKCQKYITEALKGNTKIDPDAMKEAIADFAVRNGDAPLTPWHLDTIIRTNLQSAFSKGRYIEQRNSDNPYWQYLANLDGRETELCHSLDGQVFRKNDAFWSHYYPPNHFNCRSTVVTLDEDTLKEEGLEVEQSGNDFLKKLRKSNPDLAKKLYPGHGFRTSPRRGISQWITKKSHQLKTPVKQSTTPVFKSVDEAAEYLKAKFNLDYIKYSKCNNLDVISELANTLDNLNDLYKININYIKFVNQSNYLVPAWHARNVDKKYFGLVINMNKLNGKSLSEINKWVKSVKFRNSIPWWTAEELKDIFIHEIGHNLTFNNLSLSDVNKDVWSLYKSTPSSLPFISEYGKDYKLVEYLAELFTYYMQGNKLSKDQSELLSSVLGVKT